MWIKRDLQDQLATMVRRAVEAAQDDGALVLHESNIDVQIEVPRDRAHGDFATNAALALAGAAGMPPRQLAQQIVERLPVEETDFLDGVEIAGPGGRGSSTSGLLSTGCTTWYGRPSRPSYGTALPTMETVNRYSLSS